MRIQKISYWLCGAAAFLSVLVFIFGCTEMAAADKPSNPDNVLIAIPGTEIEIVDTRRQERAVAILGGSVLALCLSSGLLFYVLRAGGSREPVEQLG